METNKINIYKNFNTQINDKKIKLIEILKKLKKQKNNSWLWSIRQSINDDQLL